VIKKTISIHPGADKVVRQVGTDNILAGVKRFRYSTAMHYLVSAGPYYMLISSGYSDDEAENMLRALGINSINPETIRKSVIESVRRCIEGSRS